jgi:signal transduction histidine kinase
MKPRTSSRLAWSIGIVSIAMLVGQLILMFIDRRLAYSTEAVFATHWTFENVLNVSVTMAVPLIGIVLASRRPDNPIGWLFLAAGLIQSVSGFGASYGLHALVADPGSLPAGRELAWASNWLGLVLLGLIPVIFLLFPTGHLPSAGWRPVAWLVGAALALSAATALVYATEAWNHPFKESSSAEAFFLGVVPILGAFAAALAALVVRFRRSAGDERLQLRWFVTGAVLVVVTLVATIFVSSPALSLLQDLASVFFFTSIGIAVLKYRLYEIDVVISKTVVYGVLAAVLTLVYVSVVVGVGQAVGSAHHPSLTLLAAALIALAFNPVRDRAKRLANRMVYGRRASPYEVLSEFSDRVAGTYSVEDVLPTMARILGEGTGARHARVWLRVGPELRAAATWGDPGSGEQALPLREGELPEVAGASRVVAVRYGAELLGALAVTKPPNEPLSVAEGKLIDDLAAQAGLVLRNVRLTEELRANLEDLRASRRRLVSAQDEERRRIERNIHDGAQQQLVALAVKLNLAQMAARRDAATATEQLLEQLKVEAQDALETLRDLARGIYPPLLADKGLAAALEAQARKAAVPTTVEPDGVGRYPRDVEAAVYFCALEGMQNVAKYAHANSAVIRLAEMDGSLVFEIEDDGRGFDPTSIGYGTGLKGMADRLDVINGTLEVKSAPGRGTVVRGLVKLAPSD